MDVKCSLVTGQEKIELDNATHFSCTIEMCPTVQKFNIAIIDEIQLIGDEYRGSAWTTALLGLQAEEIHICGEERALKLVNDICQSTGDTLIKKTYTRLGDLIVEDNKLNSVSELKTGDCIVAFSKKEIFRIKEHINSSFRFITKQIDNITLNKCSVIYGNLPPEIKKVQANAFNERKNGISFLIATDAVNYIY
jgi:ATP-dependent RNA helicase SUPV3L1/SUV3